jgi:hypothetical protein
LILRLARIRIYLPVVLHPHVRLHVLQ